VFGTRVVEAVAAGRTAAEPTGAMRAALGRATSDVLIGGMDVPRPKVLLSGHTSPDGLDPERRARRRDRLQRVMTREAGILRSATSLTVAQQLVAEVLDECPRGSTDPATAEVRNVAEVGTVLLAAAEARRESRGAHTRIDFPDTSDGYRARLVVA
jgi:aspartate oxidase